MKIVLNVDYGGIGETSAAKRLDPKFIEDVETGRFVGEIHEKWGFAETLKVFEIPDEATDYRIVNYDGCEGIIYCLNGKLCFVGSDECECIFRN